MRPSPRSRPSTRCTRSTCPASAPPRSPCRPPTTPSSSPATCCASWTRWRSTAPTWSATRWAAGSRSRSALQAPSRVRTLSLLAPSMAFKRGREWAPLVRLLRPELAALPHVAAPEPGPRPLLEHDRPPRAARPLGRRHRLGRVPAHLPLAHRPDRLLRRRPPDLPRGPRRPEGVLDPARGARAAGAVHLGQRGPARPGPLLPPRRRDPARRAPGRPLRVRPRAPGRAARAHPRAGRRVHRLRGRQPPAYRRARLARSA